MTTLATELRQLAAQQRGQPRLYSLAQLLADPTLTQPPEAVVPRLAYAGRTSLLVAGPKVGKSTFACAGGAAVSTGGAFLGDPTTQGTVLVIALDEHLGELARRLPRFGADPAKVFVCDHLGSGDRNGLIEAIVAVEPRLVIVDALYRLAELAGVIDPGRSSEWPRILDPLVDITREIGCGTLLLHHARKSDGKYRDSSAIAAAVDAVIELHLGSDPRERDIRTEARWPAEPFRIRLTGNLPDEGTVLRYELAGHAISLDARIILHVADNPGCSAKALRSGVQGRSADIDEARDALIARGGLEDRGGVGGMSLYVTRIGMEGE